MMSLNRLKIETISLSFINLLDVLVIDFKL